MAEGSKIFSKADAVPVENLGTVAALNWVTCVATLYHSFHGQQPYQFDLNYTHKVDTPEQAYIRERLLGGPGGVLEWPVGFDYLTGKVGSVIIQNLAGLQTMAVQPSDEERAIVAQTVLKVTVAGVVFLVRPGRFMLFELYDDTSVAITIQPVCPQYVHPVKIVGLPK